VFLLLENDEVFFMDRVVALVRADGRTEIVMKDGAVRATAFTPATLARRCDKFLEGGGVERRDRLLTSMNYGRGNIER
jgi:hypothetical protein